MARPVLGVRLGEKEPGAVEKALIENVQKRVAGWEKIVGDSKDKNPFRPFYGDKRKPSSLGTEAVLNALVLVNQDVRRAKGELSAPARKALGHLWEQQQADGAWLWLDFGLRPWETDATYFGASLAALAVGMAGTDYVNKDADQPKLALLKKHLTSQYSNQRLHHRMVTAWASAQLPGILRDDDKKKLIDGIIKLQEADGGWSLPNLGKYPAKKGEWASHGVTREGAGADGYATGLSVLSLKSMGIANDHPAVKKGVAWLTANEKDGVWPAYYLNRARDPESDTGKFMRDAATAFAVLALAEARVDSGR
jgi:squalene-hopene/tetraprenyl-beta-curcumene cyclase